jgi:hypothetical protein
MEEEKEVCFSIEVGISYVENKEVEENTDMIIKLILKQKCVQYDVQKYSLTFHKKRQ